MKKLKYSLLLVGLALIFQSCATLFAGGNATIHVQDGSPPGAEVYHNGAFKGSAPISVKISKKGLSTKSTSIEIKKEGYETSTINLQQKVMAGFVIMDILFTGFIVGIAIDFATGSIYKPTPEKIDYKLEKNN